MNITQIRNATQRITYGGKSFLIDPMLAEKEAYPGFAGSARAELRNPRVDLPVPLADLLDVDAIIVTHTHLDHWDDAAVALIPKSMLIFVQNQRDEALLQEQGFTHLQVVDAATRIGDVTLMKTNGQHGPDAAYTDAQLAARLGEACGVVFTHPREKTLYLAGDTVWVPAVEAALRQYQPEVVVLNAGWAHIIGVGAIIMGSEDLLRTHRIVPQARIIATHMEAINHCLLTRAALREYVDINQFGDRVSIPLDGETVSC
ncbi:hypothetical protein CHU32_15790 [Superficieibacter electus]|uniref:Metallo-beta-lactamase domain-containing protein n=1 Tax=Superficieibacter electus TaxID=2022662 RepID=A0A2P5GMV2_9ENTR|nr:MBL fold metallo-hydrolase [Superficieibacter electus]POP44654.1 hypothetical protein CHU33_11975 [Superficieibacter electus]POP47457.1 hypothetical protein CHU32_15790 [Superficieibacter electus]